MRNYTIQNGVCILSSFEIFQLDAPPRPHSGTDKFDDTLNHDINRALTETEQQQEETMKQCRAQEELLYDNLEETALIPVSDGQVTFCRHFKYLGSYVSVCLCDDDIDKRIAALLRPKPWVPSKQCGTALTWNSGASINSSDQPP